MDMFVVCNKMTVVVERCKAVYVLRIASVDKGSLVRAFLKCRIFFRFFTHMRFLRKYAAVLSTFLTIFDTYIVLFAISLM